MLCTTRSPHILWGCFFYIFLGAFLFPGGGLWCFPYISSYFADLRAYAVVVVDAWCFVIFCALVEGVEARG